MFPRVSNQRNVKILESANEVNVRDHLVLTLDNTEKVDDGLLDHLVDVCETSLTVNHIVKVICRILIDKTIFDLQCQGVFIDNKLERTKLIRVCT